MTESQAVCEGYRESIKTRENLLFLLSAGKFLHLSICVPKEHAVKPARRRLLEEISVTDDCSEKGVVKRNKALQ